MGIWSLRRDGSRVKESSAWRDRKTLSSKERTGSKRPERPSGSRPRASEQGEEF